MEPAITVRPDGSRESLAAAHRAAEEAQRRELTADPVLAGVPLHESPADAVPREAESAGLPAVGRRRHRTAPTARLGPVARTAVHHARRADAVVPHD